MGYENVNLWFADNKNNEIITIDDINNKNKHDTYKCPVCGSEVIPSAIESVKVTPHFKHLDRSKCSAESQIHWWYKNKFIMPGDSFRIVSDKEREYICKEIKIEQEYKVGDKIYKPDMTIITESGETIYFEMNYTNKKKVEDYLDLWLELENIVVEIDIKQLMQRNVIPTFTALFYNGKCFNTKKQDIYYNTIGKYKEEQYRNGIDEKRKEQIKKLDWFWRDVFRYKKGEVDIEYMVDEIDAIGNKELIYNILNKFKCTNIYDEMIKNKNIEMYKNVQSYLEDNYPNIKYSLIKEEIHKKRGKNRFSINIKFKYNERNEYTWPDELIISNIIEHSYRDIIERIIIRMENDLTRDSFYDKVNKAKNNKALNNAVEYLNIIFKKIDKRYKCKDTWNGDWPCQPQQRDGFKVKIDYNFGNPLIIDVPDDLIYTNNEIKIKSYFIDKTGNYIKNIHPLLNIDIIEKLLHELSNKYDHALIGEIKTVKGYGIWSKTKIQQIGCQFNYDFISPEKINIKINCERGDKTKIDLILYQNKLISTNMGEKTKIIAVIKDTNEWNELKEIIEEIILDLIFKSLNTLKCIDCNHKLSISRGEFNFFINHNNLSLPKRCPSCRKKRKQERQKARNV